MGHHADQTRVRTSFLPATGGGGGMPRPQSSPSLGGGSSSRLLLFLPPLADSELQRPQVSHKSRTLACIRI